MNQKIIFSGVNIGMTPHTVESLLFSGRALEGPKVWSSIPNGNSELFLRPTLVEKGIKLFLYYQVVAEMLKLIYYFV